MNNWIKGHKPEDTSSFYWITRKSSTANITHELPCRYDEGQACWIDFNGNRWSYHCVVAYCEIKKPKNYSTIGHGTGFYIRTFRDDQEVTYGHGLQLANWVGRGYKSIDSAVTATRRLIKLDLADNCEREVYEVVNGQGEVVWTRPNKK